MLKSPNEGGCWFCSRDTGHLRFSSEFDTFVHEECIRDALRVSEAHYGRLNPEADIMARELDLHIQQPILPKRQRMVPQEVPISGFYDRIGYPGRNWDRIALVGILGIIFGGGGFIIFKAIQAVLMVMAAQ